VLFFFDFDRDIFRPEFEEELQQVVSEISEFPENRFEIAGYTDEKGSDAYNDKLSLRRARNIKQMLVDRGIPEDKLEVVGRGKGYPVIPNAKTEEENAQNRRVEINIITE
jgi:OOP family OmpA-OmpF porin